MERHNLRGGLASPSLPLTTIGLAEKPSAAACRTASSDVVVRDKRCGMEDIEKGPARPYHDRRP